ncbi:hypothetical protein LOAG_18445 [Loa loa]|uniref:Centromere protein S n=2 Tax=Loa loa TaxID=7209 RepID=A0A1S0UH48_LOALO|nr:hypothetical protein LOAG_18445 [Loa loa]EJD74207.1 hypothetical protein LOAG_18445 [Loa loa]
MDDIDFDGEDGNGKLSMIDEEDLTVIPSKRSKEEKEKPPKGEVSKHEYQEIIDAIHYSCMLIQDEVVEELEKKGQEMEFEKEVVAQVAFAICDTLCLTWPSELLQFAKHGRRSIVNISDLTLLFRRNENMLSLIRSIGESSLLPVRKRQPRKGASKKNNKATDSSRKMDSENSRDVGALSPDKDTLKLADFWDQPSTSRKRPLLLLGASKYTSATTEGKFLPDSISLQRKEVTAKKDETLPCCKEKADITESRKKDNGRERQNQTTEQRLQPAFLLYGSETGEEQKLESLDINIPCYSNKEDLQHRKPQCVTGSLSVPNRKIRGINKLDLSICTTDISREVKVNVRNPTVPILESDNEMLVESSTTVAASPETTSHIKANKTDRDKMEFRIENVPDGKPIFSARTPDLNSMRRISGRQLTDTSLRNRSSAADDCFSSFKFESDDEDSDQSLVMGNKVTNDKNAVSPSVSNNRCSTGECASMSENREHRDISGEESDVDLDATVFDF